MDGDKPLGSTIETLTNSGVTFAQAMQRLEFLKRELQRGDIELEALREALDEIDLLLRFCTQKIGLVRTSVNEVVEGWTPLLSILNEEN
ncbi:MAG: exodeoxyribonuclease VII small subunit [Bacteroides sp.]